MNATDRLPEAHSLRQFFDEQITHLHNLVSEVYDVIQHDKQQTEEDQQIIEEFVDVTNRKMRAVEHYADKLRIYVRTLYHHVLDIADTVPAPIDLNNDAFHRNGLVNALFVNANDIAKLFQTDPKVNAFWQIHKDLPMYAILTANKSEKSVFGIAMQNDMLVRDVVREEVNFSTYQIHSPCTNHIELQAAFRQYLFNRAVELIKQDLEQAHAQPSIFNSDHSYQTRVNSLANPDVYLNKLIAYMEKPDELLSIKKSHLKLSKLGIKLSDDDTQNANEFDIYELIWRDDIRVVILQIVRSHSD